MNCNDLDDKANSLDDDGMLIINKLKAYCDKYKAYCESLDNEMKSIEKSLDMTELELLNAVNSLKKLSLTKYTVFSIDSKDKKEKSQNSPVLNDKGGAQIQLKELKAENTWLRYKEAIDMSITNLNIKQSNEKKKERNVKLPHIIGTRDFFYSETLGVVNEKNEEREDRVLNKSVKAQATEKEMKQSNKTVNDLKKQNNKVKSESENLNVKSFDQFNDKEDQDDFDDFIIKQYDRIPSNQSQYNQPTTKSNISIEQFVKKGLFDIEDEEDNSNKEEGNNKPKDEQKKSPIISKGPEIDKGETVLIQEEEEKAQMKIMKDAFSLKKKEIPLESAKQKLLKLFDEEEEDENKNKNEIETITKKTNEFTKKLEQITADPLKISSNGINHSTQASVQQYQHSIKEDKRKDIDKQFTRMKNKPQSLTKELPANETKVDPSQQNPTKTTNINRLNSIFLEDEENDSTAIAQSQVIIKNDLQQPRQIEAKAKKIPKPQTPNASFEKGKSNLNEFLPLLKKTEVISESNEQIQVGCLDNTQSSTTSIIKKIKPHKPSFTFHDEEKDQLKKETFNFQSGNNKLMNAIEIKQKPLIKLNFTFDDE